MIKVSKKASVSNEFSFNSKYKKPSIIISERLFVLGNKFLLLEEDNGILESSLYLNNRSWFPEILSKKVLKTVEFLEGTTIVIGNASINNYYHWVYQQLSSLLFCKAQLNVDTGAIRVLGPKKNSFISQYLEFFDDIEYCEVDSSKTYILETGVYSDLLWGDFSYRPTTDIGELMRHFVVEDKNLPKRVYISRGDTPNRRVSNEDQVISLVSKYGFEPVKLTEYSVREQISLFNNVEYVIAPHGAGLTNLVFCNEKANVIELLQDNYLNWCFKFLCQGKGLRYTGLINSTKVLSQDKHKDEIEIDLELLEKSISE
ncbi:MAG: hypothetical protein CML60_02700 [Rhodobacteraceae bacterium]|nr:hypothetical protein [Paracoccaceae bacterium]